MSISVHLLKNSCCLLAIIFNIPVISMNENFGGKF